MIFNFIVFEVKVKKIKTFIVIVLLLAIVSVCVVSYKYNKDLEAVSLYANDNYFRNTVRIAKIHEFFLDYYFWFKNEELNDTLETLLVAESESKNLFTKCTSLYNDSKKTQFIITCRELITKYPRSTGQKDIVDYLVCLKNEERETPFIQEIDDLLDESKKSCFVYASDYIPPEITGNLRPKKTFVFP